MTYTVDAFPFWAELDVLEMRLTELYDVVDKFVLVEATRTHKGNPKPLSYAENRRRFGRWNDKIIHVVWGDMPEGDSAAAIWRREIGQRQTILRGLADIPDDAMVLISDVDEIPRREAVEFLKQHSLDDVVVTFKQQLYYYNVNTACNNIEWLGTRATTAGNVRALTPDGTRWSGLRSHEYPKLVTLGGAHTPERGNIGGAVFGMPGAPAGWHLSYFGDVQHIQNKMRAFLHQELVNETTLDPDAIARRMAEGVDVWGREGEQRFTIGPALDMPRAIRCAPHRWLPYFHPDWRPSFTEEWYDPDQAWYVGSLARQAPEQGAYVEIGCWEGRSAVAIAQAISPRVLFCVDHWRGNEEEGDAESVGLARARDIGATFAENMRLMAPDNWIQDRRDWRDWARSWDVPIAFLHLDASHDEASVRECLEAVRPFLVPHAVLCGDDSYAPGVWNGARAVLGDIQEVGGRLWVWQNGGGE